MPFPKKLLNDYEDVAVDLHPHWWFFAEPAAALIVAVVLAIVAAVKTDSGNLHDVLTYGTIALIVVAVVWLVVRYLDWATTNFVITSDRLIYRHGVFAKSGIEIPLERVMNVNFHQSFFERIIGAGDLLIESGGADGQQRFTDIRRPETVQNRIHAEIERNDNRKFGSAGNLVAHAPTAGADVASQLEKLEGLLQRGTITQAEFDAQKAKLLGP
jgi:uncharacterized membrane protein YdbT with pleckstrin-like domain